MVCTQGRLRLGEGLTLAGAVPPSEAPESWVVRATDAGLQSLLFGKLPSTCGPADPLPHLHGFPPHHSLLSEAFPTIMASLPIFLLHN